MKQRGISIAKLALDLNLSEENIILFQNNIFNADIDVLILLANYLDVSVDYLLGNADSKEKQPDSQNENQAVKDELIAFYGDVKDDLTPDDIDDLMVAMRAKAERNKKKKSGV